MTPGRSLDRFDSQVNRYGVSIGMESRRGERRSGRPRILAGSGWEYLCNGRESQQLLHVEPSSVRLVVKGRLKPKAAFEPDGYALVNRL